MAGSVRRVTAAPRTRAPQHPIGRIPVLDVRPCVDAGARPAKSVVAEEFDVTATVFREGHDKLGAEVVLTGPDGTRRLPVRMVAHGEIPDRYEAWVTPDAPGAWTFEIQAWSDPVVSLSGRSPPSGAGKGPVTDGRRDSPRAP